MTTAHWRGIAVPIPLEIEAADEATTRAFERAAFAAALGWTEAEVDAERAREAALVAEAKGQPVLLPPLTPRSPVTEVDDE